MPKISILQESCKSCHLCIPVCKPGVIATQEVNINRAGYFPVAYEDPDGRCTGCRACALVCPDIAIRVFK